MSQTFGVTGVSSGIGAMLARRLKQGGHRVVGYDIKEASAHVDVFIPLDLSDMGSIQAAAAQTPFKLDGLCNNAGLPPRAGMEAAILQVNFTGTRAFTGEMLGHLNPKASIVNMASRAGHGWRENLDQVKRLGELSEMGEVAQFVAREALDATRCYNLSKEAVILWSVSIAEQMVTRGFRVNSLSPGGIATGILDDFQKAFGDQMARNVARAGRVGDPEEVAEIAAFVLSPQSHWLKGADIPIDGGMGAFNMSDALDLGVMRGAFGSA